MTEELINIMKNVPAARMGKYKMIEGEKGPEWYDASFEHYDHWRSHYSQSRYYFFWSVIVDRLLQAGHQSIFEIGCGPGQLACLLRDKGFRKYHGFDFSPKRIEYAKKVCPQLNFSLQDAFETDLFTTFDYDAVVCTEFLEHIERDIDIINRIKSGVRFLGSVPNFPFTSHVRHFKNIEEVRARYSQHFQDFRIDTFLADPAGKIYFLLDGVKK